MMRTVGKVLLTERQLAMVEYAHVPLDLVVGCLLDLHQHLDPPPAEYCDCEVIQALELSRWAD